MVTININFLKDGKGNPVVLLTESTNLLTVSGLLTTKLITGKAPG